MPSGSSSIPCPSDSDLQAFALGNLSSAELDRCQAHLLTCDACDQRLHDLDGLEDELVVGLRQLNDTAGATPSWAESLPTGWSTASAVARQAQRELVIDPGKRLARRLSEGPVRLGQFELLSELGVGSFGYVFRAYDTKLERVVALKVQRAGSMASDDELNRFSREARSAAQLHHPGIVALYETGTTDDGVYFLVSEFIEGQTLEQLAEKKDWSFNQIAEFIGELSETLDFAHKHGVIHRDIKPSNVILDADGHPHIADFGLAKREATDLTVTRDGEVIGTPSYMSPEQAQGHAHDVDARTDIYSLGVVLYELITGERPFHGNHRMLLLQVLEDEPRAPRALRDKVPRDLETICLKAMAKSPARRYQTAKQLAQDLERFNSGQPIQARPINVVERLWSWCRRNPAAVSLFVSTVLASLLGIVYLVYMSKLMVKTAALQSATMQAQILEELNAFYSELVGRLDPELVELTHEYIERPGTLPLPATFTIDASKRISKSLARVKVRLFSDYPFPWRTEGGPRDDFEKRALQRLRAAPELPVHEFAEIDGKPVLRYAVARVMKTSCLDCHNHHPLTPKTDWKPGDVRGVLQIIRPLDTETSTWRSGLMLLASLFAVAAVGMATFYSLRRSAGGRGRS